MNKKGIVSEIKGDKARVIFPEIDNLVSGWLPIPIYKVYCAGICNCGGCYAQLDISVGSHVVVALFDNDFKSGVIIAKVG